MSEENQNPFEAEQGSAPGAGAAKADPGWEEVGRQFQALGESLAQAVRTAWANEETQRTVHEMRDGLESMVQKVGKAIDESASSPQGQQIRQDAEKAAEALRSASEQTVQEVRPQLINALEQVNTELQKLINRMQQPSSTSTPPDPQEPAPNE